MEAGPKPMVAEEETQVLILGAGCAGISVANALHIAGHSDFLMLEYNDTVGGRVRSATFGENPVNGSPYVLELGANWITGLESEDGEQNPIWRFAQQHGMKTYETRFGDLAVYDHTGETSISDELWEKLSKARNHVQDQAEQLAQNGGTDCSIRAALNIAGWNPGEDPKAQALEWYEWDWDAANILDRLSVIFEAGGEQFEDPDFGDDDMMVIDQRGYSHILNAKASEFLQPNDPRLRLNTVVTDISWSEDSVTVDTRDGKRFKSRHAVCTFSLGVLQKAILDIAGPSSTPVSFIPRVPNWKREAVASFDFGTYTKIFLQFRPSEQFWPPKEHFVFVHPDVRGRFTVWQNLSHPRLFPGSGILFATVVTPESARVEAQTDEVVKTEMISVLRQMFPFANVPEPMHFMFHRWGMTEWSFGSYSTWPVGTTEKHLEDLRRNVGNLWFAGEHTSLDYRGYVHGAWLEGKRIGEQLSRLLAG